MATLTVAEKIAIAEINEYLISNAIQKKDLFAGGINIDLPTKIRVIREGIEYRYNQDPSDTTLTATSNYMLSLCLYLSAAKAITGNAGVVAGVASTSPPNDEQFTVAASGTFLVDGQSSKTITAFIGYNLLYVRNGIPQYTVNDGSGTYYSWTKSTGGFVSFPAVVTGEIIRLAPL